MNMNIYIYLAHPQENLMTVKIRKLYNDNNVQKLLTRPIIYNTSTATYHLAKYLSKLISTPSTAEYTVSSTKNLYRIYEQLKYQLDNIW